MKKVLIIISSLIILGCSGEEVEIKTRSEKRKMAMSSIVNNDTVSQKDIERIMIKLKEQMDNEKFKETAAKEYNDWIGAIEFAEIEKEIKEESEKNEFFGQVMFLLIKNKLRDPDSYVLENIFYFKKGNVYDINHYYRAKNGFGGYTNGSDYLTIELTEEEFSDSPIVVVNKILTAQAKETIEKLKKF